jgi:hypothetical protein
MLKHTHMSAFAIAVLITAAFTPSARAQWNCSSSTCTFDGNVGIGTSPQVALEANGAGRFDNWSTPTSGAGLELGFLPAVPRGYFQAFDRSAGAFRQLNLDGSPLILNQFSGANVGIGTATPLGALDIAAANTWSYFRQNSGGNPSPSMPFGIALGNNRSDGQAEANIVFGNVRLDIGSWIGSTYTGALSVLSGGYVGIGTTSPQHLLHVAGTIGAEEVIVSSTGADYVFGPGYRLPSLTEVAAYIADHHHLPDIPSAAEMKERGVGVADMQAKLLAKIEELTLHMIHAEERNNRLEQENRELKRAVQRIQERIGQ